MISDAYAFRPGSGGDRVPPASVDQCRAGEGKAVTVEQFAWVDRLKAESPATAMGDALREVMNRKRGQPLAGVVLRPTACETTAVSAPTRNGEPAPAGRRAALYLRGRNHFTAGHHQSRIFFAPEDHLRAGGGGG
jgi:hypothetical protein